jgi:hypothetical protein
MTKLLFLFLAFCAASSQALTLSLKIERVYFGSGLQNAAGFENAEPVGDYGVWHVPQYMPGYPTSETIWPRVVEVRCTGDQCEGYTISPSLGRGEYLFFKPVKKPAP